MNVLVVVGLVVGAAAAAGVGAGTVQLHRSLLKTARGHEEGPRPVAVPLDGLARLRIEAEAAGFAPVDEGLVRLGDTQLLVMLHADGTRAELLQRPDLDAGFGLATVFVDGRRVVSVPWGHGVDPDRIRVPGASFGELLERHRAAVAERTGPGSAVEPADPATALGHALESDRDELRTAMERPWRHSLTMTLQQLPPWKWFIGER